MKGFKIFQVVIALIMTSLVSLKGQTISTPCTTSVISSFTPCMNFLTGSTGNGTSTPTHTCCETLKSMMSTSVECGCLLITANIPIPIPINRTLALSLPRACNLPGVPIQCKSAGSPLPAPGPALLGPTPSPIADSPFSPRGSKAAALAPAPETDMTDDLGPAPSATPPTSGGIRPVQTPSASTASSEVMPQSILKLVIAGMIVLSCI